VVYSQGNFVSNQRAQYKDGGILFELNLLKTGGDTRVEDYSYMPAWVYREDLPARLNFYVLPVSLYENNPSAFNLKDSDKYKISLFSNDTRALLKGIPENTFFNGRP
jgi:poly-gamma-glutamate synthesis protein (capsule biosynthesis protein)